MELMDWFGTMRWQSPPILPRKSWTFLTNYGLPIWSSYRVSLNISALSVLMDCLLVYY